MTFLLIHCLQGEEPGTASLDGSMQPQDSSWQTWTFMGTTALTATAGILAVSMSKGASHSH